MVFTDHFIYHRYGLLLATLKKFKDKYILNRVRDLNPDEIPINSIGILRVGESDCTAWVVAIPKQLSIKRKRSLVHRYDLRPLIYGTIPKR